MAGALEGVRRDLKNLVELRGRLLQAELRSDLATCRRSLTWVMIAGVSATVAVTLLSWALCATLAQATGWSTSQWCVAIAIPLFMLAGILALAAWLHFRREFTGLRDSIAELREDLAMIRMEPEE